MKIAYNILKAVLISFFLLFYQQILKFQVLYINN